MLRMEGREYVLPPGTMFVLLPPEKAEYFFDPQQAHYWTFRWANMGGMLSRVMWGEFRRRFGPVVHFPEGTPACREWERMLEVAERRSSSGIWEQAEAAHALFTACWLQLDGLLEAPGAPDDPVARLRELIRARFSEPVNLKELCAEVGQSREHLSRRFKEAYGQEPGGYMRQLRQRSAMMFLEHSMLPLEEVARRSGYSSAAQLVRSFTRDVGIPPGAWRQKIRRSARSVTR